MSNLERIEELQHQIADLSKKVERLQEQLADAEKALRFYDSKDFHYEGDGVVMGAEPAHRYFVKWAIPSEKCQKGGNFPSKKCKNGESAIIKKENK